MAVPDPCCGCMTRRSGSLAISIVEIAYVVIFYILFCVIPYEGKSTVIDILKTPGEGKHNQYVVPAILVFVLLAYDLMLSIFLLIAVTKKNYIFCRIWFFLTLISSLFYFVIFILFVMSDMPSIELIIICIISIPIRTYARWIIFAYQREIQPPDATNQRHFCFRQPGNYYPEDPY